MSSNDPKVLGEGTYGCVHKPSLKCKNKDLDYTNKISKFMQKRHALTELNEYKTIEDADTTQQFYNGKPEACNVDLSETSKTAIRKCDLYNKMKKERIPVDYYGLLVMEDGGTDLKQFADKMHKRTQSTESTNQMHEFWMEAHRILYGITVFADKGILHHDLKAQNIVYNSEKRRMNFIDFGLMTKRDRVLEKCRKSKYPLSGPHWSFPFEFEFVNHNRFERFANMQPSAKIEYYKKLLLDIKNRNHPINVFLSTVTADASQDVIDYFLNNYYTTITQSFEHDNYDHFLTKSVDTLDSYGAGIAFLYVLKKTFHLIEDQFSKDLTYLFFFACCSDLEFRTSPTHILTEFEIILETHGILNQFNKRIENHVIIDAPAKIPETIQNKIDDLNNTNILLSERELEKSIHASPQHKCPGNKELNPMSRRCTKKCNSGYSRNENFKCVASKKEKGEKAEKAMMIRTCPENKELNPITRRCTKKCNSGYSRNEKFKCVAPKKEKTEKPMMIRTCPENKDMNPTTRRCTKKCKLGFSRNEKFKCIRNTQ